jgi:hypothetical protein
VIQTVEAVIDEQGQVRLLGAVQSAGPRRALVTVLDEAPAEVANETALLSEAALAEDWNRPEEEATWAYVSSKQRAVVRCHLCR